MHTSDTRGGWGTAGREEVMKPARFTYRRPDTIAEALELAQNTPGAKFLAGGQSLLAMMNYRIARPGCLIDVGCFAELERRFAEDESLLLGALTRHRTLEKDELIAQRNPLLSHAAGFIGHAAIRTRGTLGGTLAHADAAAEIPAVLVALGATVFVEEHKEPLREYALDSFFEGTYTTQLNSAQLITWVRVPDIGSRRVWGFAEVSRRHGDFAEAGAVLVCEKSVDRIVSRLVLFGVADRPIWIEGAGRRTDLEASVQSMVSSLLKESSLELSAHKMNLVSHCVAEALTQAQSQLSTG